MTTSVRDLRISDEIAAAIGPARAAELRAGPWPAEYRCQACNTRGLVDGGEPIVACLDVYESGELRVWFQHAACGPARITRVPGSIPDLPDGNDTVCQFGISGGWPWLLIEVIASQLFVVSDVDEVDALTAGLSALGFQPAGDVGVPPEADRIRWRVALPVPGNAGGVYGPGRIRLIEPLNASLPPGWVELTEQRGGQCGLFVATRFGLNALHHGTAEEFLAATARAGAAGRLSGTTAAVLPAMGRSRR